MEQDFLGARRPGFNPCWVVSPGPGPGGRGDHGGLAVAHDELMAEGLPAVERLRELVDQSHLRRDDTLIISFFLQKRGSEKMLAFHKKNILGKIQANPSQLFK